MFLSYFISAMTSFNLINAFNFVMKYFFLGTKFTFVAGSFFNFFCLFVCYQIQFDQKYICFCFIFYTMTDFFYRSKICLIRVRFILKEQDFFLIVARFFFDSSQTFFDRAKILFIGAKVFFDRNKILLIGVKFFYRSEKIFLIGANFF